MNDDLQSLETELAPRLRATYSHQYGQPRPAAQVWAGLAGHLDPLAQRPARRGWRLQRAWGWSFALAGVAAVLVLGLGLGVGLGVSPRPHTAAAILAQVDAPPTDNGVQSFHGVWVVKDRGLPDLGVAPTTWRLERWFQAPGTYRSAGVLTSDDGTIRSTTMDGANSSGYWTLVEDNLIELRDVSAAYGRNQHFNPLGTGGLMYSYVPTLAGSEAINGRPAYMLDLQFNEATVAKFGRPTYNHLTVWVDQQAYFILYEEARNDDGPVMATGSYESFTLNPALDPTVFQYTPPITQPVVDNRRTITPADLPPLAQAVARQVPYRVFMPVFDDSDNLINSYHPSLPYYDAAHGVVTLGLLNSASSPRDATPLTRFAIQEGPPAVLQADGQAHPVQVGALAGQLYQRSDGWRTLAFTREGTRIMITGQATGAELLKLAAALQPLAADGAGTPSK